MKLMDLNETGETLSNWIKSCTNELQLHMCMDAIDKFIVDRFKNHVSPGLLAQTQSKLHHDIDIKKVRITGNKAKPFNLLTS